MKTICPVTRNQTHNQIKKDPIPFTNVEFLRFHITPALVRELTSQKQKVLKTLGKKQQLKDIENLSFYYVYKDYKISCVVGKHKNLTLKSFENIRSTFEGPFNVSFEIGDKKYSSFFYKHGRSDKNGKIHWNKGLKATEIINCILRALDAGPVTETKT